MSCATPTVPANSRVIYYAAPNGVLGRRIDRGPGYPPLEGFVEYIEVNDDAFTVRLRFRTDGIVGGRPLEAVLLNLNNYLRILSATADDGSLFIKDGNLTANGQPAPSLEKCADDPGETS